MSGSEDDEDESGRDGEWADQSRSDERNAGNDERDEEESVSDERKASSKKDKVMMAFGGSTEDARDDIYDEVEIGHAKRNTGHNDCVYKCKFCFRLITVLVLIVVSIFAFCFLILQKMR